MSFPNGVRLSDSIASKIIEGGFPSDLDGLRFSSALNIWEFVPFGGAGGVDHGCRAFHSVAQSILSVVATVLSLDSENYDTDAYHDLVVNNGRLTVPVGLAGKYLVGSGVQWNTNAVGQRFMNILLNGVTTIFGQVFNASGAGFTTMSGAGIFDLAVGDFIEVLVFHNSGAPLNVNRAGEFSPVLWCQKVDRGG